MKVNKLIAKSKRCSGPAGASVLLTLLQQTFGKLGATKHLSQFNLDSSMEGDKPFVRLELIKTLSEHYAICLIPEIRDHKFVIVVKVDHMLDGQGMSSKRWEQVENMDDHVIEGHPDQSLSQVATQAKEAAIKFHAQLIERLGIAYADAYSAAKKNW